MVHEIICSKQVLLHVAKLDRSEKFEAALEQARALRESFPDEGARLPDLDLLQRKTQLSGLYHQGLAALEAGRRDEAVKLLTQVVSLSPSYKEATRYLHQAVTGEDVGALRGQLQETVKSLAEAEYLLMVPSEAQLARRQGPQDPVEVAQTTVRRRYTAASAAKAVAPPDSARETTFLPFVQALPAPASQPKQELHPWNPVDHLRLLGWLFFAPDRLKAFKEDWGEETIQQIGKWPASILTWLPLLIPCLAWEQESCHTGLAACHQLFTSD